MIDDMIGVNRKLAKGIEGISEVYGTYWDVGQSRGYHRWSRDRVETDRSNAGSSKVSDSAEPKIDGFCD
jgi:hypothetical protein